VHRSTYILYYLENISSIILKFKIKVRGMFYIPSNRAYTHGQCNLHTRETEREKEEAKEKLCELFLYTANRKQHNNTMLLGAVNSHGMNDSKTKYTITIIRCSDFREDVPHLLKCSRFHVTPKKSVSAQIISENK
jgi:hypothetical protein